MRTQNIDCALVRSLSNVVCMRTGGGDVVNRIEFGSCGAYVRAGSRRVNRGGNRRKMTPEDGLGERGTADVAHAEEEEGDGKCWGRTRKSRCARGHGRARWTCGGHIRVRYDGCI